MPPFFSVVIPAYNRAALIEGALESVLAQTLNDYELIVVDDGSSDNTVEVATNFAKRFSQPVTILQQSNAGPGTARNTGIARATGQYVAFLDSDDVWLPWTLALYQKAILQFQSPSFVCGLPIDVRSDQEINVNGTIPMTVEQAPDFYSLPGNPFYRFTTSGVAVLRSSLEKVKGFTTNGFEDLDLWMRLGTEPGFVLISNPHLVVRRLLGNNLSNSRKYNQSGTSHMINAEKSAHYPGGKHRQADRRRLLTVLMRAASLQMGKTGNRRAAMSIYSQIFFWSLAERRFRYLLGLPIQILLSRSGGTT